MPGQEAVDEVQRPKPAPVPGRAGVLHTPSGHDQPAVHVDHRRGADHDRCSALPVRWTRGHAGKDPMGSWGHPQRRARGRRLAIVDQDHHRRPAVLHAVDHEQASRWRRFVDGRTCGERCRRASRGDGLAAPAHLHVCAERVREPATVHQRPVGIIGMGLDAPAVRAMESAEHPPRSAARFVDLTVVASIVLHLGPPGVHAPHRPTPGSRIDRFSSSPRSGARQPTSR